MTEPIYTPQCNWLDFLICICATEEKALSVINRLGVNYIAIGIPNWIPELELVINFKNVIGIVENISKL